MKKILFTALAAMMAATACNKAAAPQNTAAGEGAQAAAVTTSDVAYVHVEAVLAQSELFQTEGDALQKKTEKAQESWAKKGQNLEYEAAKLQEKYQKGLITTANAQAEQQKLEQRAASLQQAQQKEAQALEEENFVFTNRAQDLLRRAVESVNADRRYKMIINASALIDADSTLNISAEVLAKVNELYKAEQAEKK